MGAPGLDFETWDSTNLPSNQLPITYALPQGLQAGRLFLGGTDGAGLVAIPIQKRGRADCYGASLPLKVGQLLTWPPSKPRLNHSVR